MKTWSVGAPNPKADMYVDETPVQPTGICEQFRAMKYVYRHAPKELVNEMLEAMGLRHVAE